MIAVLCRIPARERALPDVGLRMFLIEGLIAPGEAGGGRPIAPAGGVFPLRLRRQIAAEPAGVGQGVGPADLHHGQGVAAGDGALGPLRMAPVRPLHHPPPLPRVRTRAAVGADEDDGGRLQLIAREARIGPGIERPFGLGDVARGLHEAGELGVGDVRPVDREIADGRLTRRALLPAKGIGAHHEAPALHPHHARRGGRGFRCREIGQAVRSGRRADLRPPSAGGERQGSQGREEA